VFGATKKSAFVANNKVELANNLNVKVDYLKCSAPIALNSLNNA